MTRLHGDVRVDEEAPFVEQWLRTGFGFPQANATDQSYWVGAFTMPWAGTAIAEMTFEFSWLGSDAYQHLACGLGLSSPAPSPATMLTRLASSPWDRFEGTLPVVARWTGLTATQTVNMYLRVQVGSGGPNAQLYAIAGSVRMVPA
jgi:hypothetical protein